MIEFTFNNSQIPYANFMDDFVDIRLTNGTDCNINSGQIMNYTRHVERVNPQCNKSDTAKPCTLYAGNMTPNQNIFLLYYNATGVNDVSTGNGVLDYDNFNDDNISDWTVTAGSWEVSSGIVKTTGAPGFAKILRKFKSRQMPALSSTNGYVLDIDMLLNSTTTMDAEYRMGNTTDNCAYGFFRYGDNTVSPISYSCNTTYLQSNFAKTPVFNTWEHFRFIYLSGGQTTYLNGTYLGISNHSDTVNVTANISVLYRGFPASAGSAWFDNMIVRNYYPSPPSWSIGSQETHLGLPVPTIIKPENTTHYTTNIFRNITATDDTAPSLNITLRIDGVYNSSFNITNATYSVGNLTLTGGPHLFNVSASDGPNVVYDVEYFYVWQGLNISLRNNATSVALQNWTVCFTNSTTQTCNSSVNNPAMFEWSRIPNGAVNITFSDGSNTLYYFNNTYQQAVNNSAFKNLSAVLQLKQNNTVSLSASPAWTIGVNTQATISCSVAEGSPSFYRNGILISNPYVSTLAAGNYNFSCSIGETANYAPYSASAWLYVLSGGFGCSDNTTYAFYKNISAGGSKNVTLNFTGLVASSYVLANLTDVLVNTTNTSSYANGSYLIVNTENVTSFEVYFGNFFASVNHSDGPVLASLVDNMTVYSEYNPHYYVMFIEEVNGSSGIPPGATNTMIIYCTEGTSWKDFNTTRMLIASKVQLDYMRGLVQYSATEFYYRDLLARSTVEYKNMYLVDANQKQVLQILVSLLDNTGEFLGSTLKMKKWVGGNLETINEQLFDAEGKVIVYLINGDKYQIYVDNGAEERSIGFLFADSSDLTKTIQINQIITNDFSAANFSYYLNMTGGSIVFSFIDVSGNAVSSEFYVYNWTDRDGTLLYYANSTNHSAASYSYAVPDVNGTYKVDAKIHHSVFGENTIELTQIFQPLVALIPFFLIVETIAGPMPEGLTIQAFMSVCFIFFLALMFDQRHGATAGVIVVLFAAVISYFTWWPIGAGTLVMAMVIAILNKLTSSEKGVG